MRKLLTIPTLLFCLAACQKQTDVALREKCYLENVSQVLKDSLKHEEYKQLEMARAVQSRIHEDTVYLRVPFQGQALSEAFVLLHTNAEGNVRKGRIIELAKKPITNQPYAPFKGQIRILALNGTSLLESVIQDGFIVARHPRLFTEVGAREEGLSLVQPSTKYVELPEVIVVGTRANSGNVNYSDWLLLQALLDEGGGSGGSSSGWYGAADGAGGTNSGDSGGGDPTTSDRDAYQKPIKEAPPILVDFEYQDVNPAIDIEKYLECFSAIPDAGASCSIEILADIPVDNDPSRFFNWQTRSSGHVFLKLNKRNNHQSVQQVIGWYPRDGYKVLLTSAPVSGKFVDNQSHELNASFVINISPEQLQTAITRVLYLSRFIKYDIDEYNCTDFALDVFNATVSPYDKLDIPRYDFPGSTNPLGSSTPNGVYQKLKSMKQAGGQHAVNIEIPRVKGWVGPSHGPCN